MKGTITKPVIAIVIIGIALAGLFVWRGSNRQQRAKREQATAQSADNSDSSPNAPHAEAAVSGSPHGTMLTAPVPLPLSVVLVESENEPWKNDDVYRAVPRGTQSFGGIEFHIEGMLQMQGTVSEAAGRKFRFRIPLPLAQAGVTNARVGSIHFLGGTTFQSGAGVEVAEVLWRYSDGATRRQRLIHDEHIRNWHRVPYEEPTHLPYAHTKVVWRAAEGRPDGRILRLYRVTLANPEPAKPIRQIELASGKGPASLAVVAATLDPLGPGMRSDDSPDLEPSDAVPAQQLDVWVLSPEGQPLPGAKVGVQWRRKTERGAPAGRRSVTDATGLVRVSFPPNDIGKLEITASHDDFASRKMVWDLVAGDIVPASYQIKLAGGISIGGVIVHESDSPVPDAKLQFHRFWTSNEGLERKGEQSEFGSRTTSSDLQGFWQMKNLPRDLLVNISFTVQHPDYMSTNLMVAQNNEVEKQLRAGTHKIVLHRGLKVSGLVTDENGSPIADATVWAGHRYSSDRKQANSDSAGHFALQGVAGGDVAFSAMAKGRAPASKTFKVQPSMEEILLKLGPGSVIRGLVRSQSGTPIADVRVSLENHGPSEPGYEFSTTTDANGRFEWDSAPNESMTFYFGKAGYAQRRNVTLKLNEENVITLRNPREVQGQVLDADSGQPLTKFSAAVGRSFGPDQFFADYPGTKEFCRRRWPVHALLG